MKKIISSFLISIFIATNLFSDMAYGLQRPLMSSDGNMPQTTKKAFDIYTSGVEHGLSGSSPLSEEIPTEPKKDFVIYRIIAGETGAKGIHLQGNIEDIKNALHGLKKNQPQVNTIYIKGLWPVGKFSKRLNNGQRTDVEKKDQVCIIGAGDGKPLVVGRDIRHAKHRRRGWLFSIDGYLDDQGDLMVDRDLGIYQDFKKMLDEAHRLGFKVVVDFIPNHTSLSSPLIAQHPDWFMHEVLNQQDTQLFYEGRYTELLNTHPGSFLYRCENYGPSHKERILAIRHGYGTENMNDCAQLNYANKELRAYMMDVLMAIAKAGLDGVRCDLAQAVLRADVHARFYNKVSVEYFNKQIMPEEFWKEALAQIRKGYPDFLAIAHSRSLAKYIQELGFDYIFNADLSEILMSDDKFKILLPFVAQPALRQGDCIILAGDNNVSAEEEPILAYARRYVNQVFIVAINRSEFPAYAHLNVEDIFNIKKDVTYIFKHQTKESDGLFVEGRTILQRNGKITVVLAPYEVNIFEVGEVTEVNSARPFDLIVTQTGLPSWMEVAKRSKKGPSNNMIRYLIRELYLSDGLSYEDALQWYRFFIDTFPDSTYIERLNWLSYIYGVYVEKNKHGQIRTLDEFIEHIFLNDIPKNIKNRIMSAFGFIKFTNESDEFMDFVKLLHNYETPFGIDDLISERMRNVLFRQDDHQELAMRIDVVLEAIGQVLYDISQKDYKGLDESLNTLRYCMVFANIGRQPIVGERNIKMALTYMQGMGGLGEKFYLENFIKNTIRLGSKKNINTTYAATGHIFAQDEKYFYGVCAQHSFSTEDSRRSIYLWYKDEDTGRITSAPVRFITVGYEGAIEEEIPDDNFRDYAVFKVAKKAIPVGDISVMSLSPDIRSSGFGVFIGYADAKMKLFLLKTANSNRDRGPGYWPIRMHNLAVNGEPGISGAGLFLSDGSLIGAAVRGDSGFTSSYTVLADPIVKKVLQRQQLQDIPGTMPTHLDPGKDMQVLSCVASGA